MSDDMSNPKSDCEALLNAVRPFAERMLTDYGEFIPFGGAMRPDGEIVSIAAADGHEHPKSVDIIALIKDAHVAAARDGEYKATAIVYYVRAKLPDSEDTSDAIAVALDHRDGYSVIVYIPYRIEGRKLVFGTTFATKGEADIFARRRLS